MKTSRPLAAFLCVIIMMLMDCVVIIALKQPVSQEIFVNLHLLHH